METTTYWFTRLLFQRALGLIYLIAFIGVLNQFCPLLGEKGLLPVPQFVKEVSFVDSPSLFFFFPHDKAFKWIAWLGVLLSCLAITGIADRFSVFVSITVWGLLWIFYMSFVNVGQVFYGFGWESILLEAGFYALFLGPAHVKPPAITIWMLRWLLFRVMFGAGLIKLRGDECWRDLSCLQYHYETQPMPNPLSWYLHWAPAWTQRVGVVINHVAELLIPFGYFLPSVVCMVAGISTLLFQGLIMASGNLSWLNFLTLVLVIPTFDDRWLRWLFASQAYSTSSHVFVDASAWAAGLVTLVLSIHPVRNMLSSRQDMNRTFNPLHLVGTYGAFGGITRERNEIIIEATEDSVVTPTTVWNAYEFKGKPGALDRRPPQIAPYHLRLDWLMWFAAMSGYPQHPWFVHLMEKLLQADAPTLALLRRDPFDGRRPHFIRARLYGYHFSSPAERRQTGHWWTREFISDYFPIVSLDTPGFQRALHQMGWS